MPLARNPSTWILGACCAITLVASGQFEAILRTPLAGRPVTFSIAEIALREAKVIRHGGTGEDADERDPIDWTSYIASGVIRLEASPTAAELAAYVILATQIDDGEAMTIALASSRGYGFVTDDRKAQRFLGSVPFLGTADLVHNWSVEANVDATVLGATLRAISDRAIFAPPRSHPLRGWWDEAANNN